MSGTVGLIIVVSLRLGRRISPRIEKWNDIPDWLFVVVGLVSLFFAGYLAWSDEHNQVAGLKHTIDTLSVPELKGEIPFLAFAPADEGVVMTIEVTIMNEGAPSIAKNFSLVVNASGTSVKGERVSMPPGTFTLGADNGARLTLPKSDYLPLRASYNPVPRNGAVDGYMMFLLKGLRYDQIVGDPNGSALFSFEDIRDTRCEIRKTILVGDQIISPFTLQRKTFPVGHKPAAAGSLP